VFAPKTVTERSDQPVRREEKLGEVVKVQFGEPVREVAYHENGLKCFADVAGGQKTGAFFDQKDLRQFLATHPIVKGRSVLNLFSYTGLSGIAAVKGGATRVHNVDGSEDALLGCAKHAELNGVDAAAFSTEKADIFQWFNDNAESTYDMVVLDPPALIKANRDVEEGKKAYHFLNRAAMRAVKDGGILVTSSCSHFFPEEDLAFTLRRASVQAGVRLHVLEVIRQSPDHPQSVYFPEGTYLKTFICQVTR
jgi:23S rRNA (cytosine1962-C5)-methyltransferase